MSDNFKMQTASQGSLFKSKLLAGVHHPGHISYKEDGTPVDHATEASLAALLTLLRGAGFNVALPAGAATAANQAAANTTLASILSALAQRGESVWTDDSGAFYIRIDAGGAISWTTVTGGASGGPGTGARPAAGTAAIVDRAGFEASAGGAGYSSGDLLDHFVTLDPASGAVLGHFWINATTEAVIAAPAAGNIVPLAPLPSGAATAVNQAAVIAALASIVSALALNHTDETQLHTDIATTLIAKQEAIRALLAGTLAISAAALPLPAGAATDANLTTANTSLASILTALALNHTDETQLHTDIATTLIAKEEAIRALLAGTLAVSASALPLPAGAATDANLTAANTSLASIITSLATNHTDELQLHTDIATTLIAKEEAIRALLAGTLAVSAAALPLPTGAATAANQSLGSRPKVVTTTFTPAASGTYGNTLNMGGKLTFSTGLPAGTPVILDELTLAFIVASLSGGAPNIVAFIFSGNPATTFTDGVAPTLNAADAAILVRPVTLTGQSLQTFNLWSNVSAALSTEAVVDASGNIYVGIILGGTPPTYGASPGTATVTLGLRY